MLELKRVLEPAMTHQITQPTKEQVRAYMTGREATRRPPPAPEEIRRQLGWRLVSPEHDKRIMLHFCLFPSSIGHLVVQIVLDWCIAGVRNSGPAPEW